MAKTHAEKNDKGNFFVPDVTIEGPTPTELLSVAGQWARQLGGMVIDVTPEEEEAASTSDF